jgi:hypothetical protein
MIKSPSLALFTLLACLVAYAAQAAEEVLIREYTYDASELEGRHQARQNAMRVLRAQVLEEVSTLVISESDLKRQVRGQEFDVAFRSRIRTISGGSIRGRVLDERWDGKSMWLRAEFRVDKTMMRKELEKFASETGPSDPARAAAALPRAASAAPAPAAPLPGGDVTPSFQGEYLLLAKTANIMSLLTPIRMRVAQHHSFEGAWPTSLEQLGFKVDEMSDGENIERVVLGKNGEVRALLTPAFGRNRYLGLRPKSVMGGPSLRWQCYTKLDPRIFKLPGAMPCEPGR